MNELWLKTQSFEDYFLLRLAEEAALAKRAPTPKARKTHLRACRLYRDMLNLQDLPALD
jgi:hypothetical protein